MKTSSFIMLVAAIPVCLWSCSQGQKKVDDSEDRNHYVSEMADSSLTYFDFVGHPESEFNYYNEFIFSIDDIVHVMNPIEPENIKSYINAIIIDGEFVICRYDKENTVNAIRDLANQLQSYKDGKQGNGSYGYTPEFNNTPWVFCMLNNFGGRLGLHGHLDNLLHNIPSALNDCKRIKGIGITPEASANNPVLYDFSFDCIWQENSTEPLQEMDLEQWITAYIQRRYGSFSKTAKKAWNILLNTVYLAKYNQLGQGAPESIVNARPAFVIGAASAWGNSKISYPFEELEQAGALLLEDYEILHKSEGYLYDVVTVLQQILSNRALVCHKEMVEAYETKQIECFDKKAAKFLTIIEQMELVTSTNKHYLLGRWIEQAKALANNADDVSKQLYEQNAKMLITTWGDYDQSERGKLHDYSNRQWSGLIEDFYKTRWMHWIEDRKKELRGKQVEERDWFAWEWNWVKQSKPYPTEPTQLNLKDLWGKM